MPTDTDWADHLAKLEVAEPNAHETIRLAAELWAQIPPTEFGKSSEAVRNRCRLILGEYCRRTGIDTAYRNTVRGRFNDRDRKAEPDRQEIVEPLKSWGDDKLTGPARRREIASRIIASLPTATQGESGGKPKGNRGRPQRSEARRAKQAEIVSAWNRFYESKCWKRKPGTPKAQFCESEGIEREDLDTALRRESEKKSKPKSAKR